MSNTKEMTIHELASSKNKNLRKFKKLYLQWILENKTTPKAKEWAEGAARKLTDGDYVSIEWVSSIDQANNLCDYHKQQMIENAQNDFENEVKSQFKTGNYSYIFDELMSLENEVPIENFSISKKERNNYRQDLENDIAEVLASHMPDRITQFVNDQVNILTDNILEACEEATCSIDPKIINGVTEYLNDGLSIELNDYNSEPNNHQAFDAVFDAGWLAYYRFFELAGLTEYPKHISDMLKWYERLIRTCKAMYVIGNNIILVRK